MQVVNSIADVRRRVAEWRRGGQRIVFVPTMGNLHEGHLTLVDRAREAGERVVVSIFVNPTQFVAGEDFDAYPRTPAEDRALLESRGADLLFLPLEQELYPSARDAGTWVEVPGLSDILCGASRPGHFRGVTTVVAKLFNIVQPDVAVFGEKDFQQLAVLRRMAADLCMPVEVAGVPTVREADGLAMSSRNGYLSSTERQQAPELYRTLCGLAEALQGGRSDYAELERQAMERLAVAGFEPDYVAVRRASDLGPPAPYARELVILGAARLGRARLIDNLTVGPEGGAH